MNGQRHKKTLSIIWSVSSHNSASSKGKLCCRQKNHQKAASLSAVLCAVQLNRLSSKSHCTYNKYRICCRVCDVTQQQTSEDRSSFIKGSVQTSYMNNHTNNHSRLQLKVFEMWNRQTFSASNHHYNTHYKNVEQIKYKLLMETTPHNSQSNFSQKGNKLNANFLGKIK